jgi:transketolase
MMKPISGLVAAAFLVVPLVLAGENPPPTPQPGVAGGTYVPGSHYSAVKAQQGRVQTDADWNEQLQACKRQNDELKKKFKARANELEIQLNQLQAAANKVDDSKKSAQDHNKAMKDSIRKLLDQWAEINRATNL